MIERSEPIEDYLDRLLAALRGAPRDIRRMLAETEQHLYESADAAAVRGLDAEQAAREAIELFGPVSSIAALWNEDTWGATAGLGPSRRRVVLGRLRRRRTVIVASGLAGMVAGLMYAWVAPPQPRYTSTTTVSVYPDQMQATGARTNSNVNMGDELQFLSSPDVVTAAKDLLKDDTDADVLAKSLTAAAPTVGLIDVSYTSSTPIQAQQYSHAFAQAYLQVRTDQLDKPIEAQIETLGDRVLALQPQVTKWAGVVARTARSAPAHRSALVQLDAMKGELASVRQRIQQLRQVDPTAGAIIQDATAPTVPSNSEPLLVYLLVGLSGGLLIAASLAAATPTGSAQAPPAMVTA